VTPPDDDAVLSQAAIDELMAGRGGGTQPPSMPAIAPPPAPAAEPEDQPAVKGAARVSVVPATAKASVPGAGALSDLVHRLGRLEAAVSSIGQSEGPDAPLQAQLAALSDQLRALSARVDEILRHLTGTMGYRGRETFRCGSCGAQGFVAFPIMCTHCRQQTWLGWWPQT